jgi:hypothetical protein
MKFESHACSAAARPDWTYSVQSPRILSPLWVLERLAGLSIPIAIFAVIAAANHLGYISL